MTNHQDALFVASVNNFAIVDYQPDKAGTDGYSDLGFKKVYTPGLSTINRYNADGSFDSFFVPAGLGDENITVASGLTYGPDGLIYINDQGANSVKKFDLSGNFQGYFLNGTAPDTPEEVVIGQDGINDYSLYVSSLTGDGVKRYDFETGALIDHIAFIPGTTTPLSAALMEFDQDGNLYIGGVFSTSQVIKYDPDTQQVETFIPTDTAQLIPSGIAFDGEGNLYNGTFSGPTFGLPNTTIAQYNSGGNLLDSNYVDNSSGELDISSRVRLFDLDGNGTKEFYVSNFGGSSIMKYLGPDENTPGASEGAYISDAVSGGSLSNPGGLIYLDFETTFSVDITGAPLSTNQGSFLNLAIEFGENVTGFSLSDINVTNGSVSELFKIDGNSYTVNINPYQTGDIVVQIPEGVVLREYTGDSVIETNQASTPVSINFSSSPTSPLSKDALFVASVNNFAIVDYQPGKAGTDGYSDLGFKKVYTPGLSTINRYNADGSFDSFFVPAGLGDENITVASGLTYGPDGLIYINDQGANSVKKFDLSGNFQGYFLNGTAPDTPEEVVIGQDGINDYSLYVSSLTGDGVKRYDFETGALIDHIAFIPGTTTPLSVALMEFDQDGNLYIGGVFSTSQVIKYDPDTQQVETFIPTDTAQLIPSGIAFDGEGNLYNGTFSGPTFGLPNTTIAQYNSGGNLLDSNYVDNSSGELDISSRVRLFDLDGNGTKEFYVSNFGGSSIMKYLGPDENTPGASEGAYISDAVSGGSLSNPGGLIFVQGEASAEINFIPANPGSNLGSLTYNSGDTTAVSVVQQALDQTDALFDNLIGLYRVANDQGAVFDIYDSNSNGSTEDLLNPGDFGYAVTALSQYEANVLLRLGAEGDAAKNTTAAQFGDVLINGGQYYAPFVIANGGNLLASGDTLADGIAKFLETNLLNTGATLDNFLTHEVAYFSFGAANPDGTEHLQSFGNNIFGFEDLPGNLDVSDFDFNDTVFEFSFA